MQGARQVGKTYLLKEFGSNEFKQVHYINFEKGDDVDVLFKEDFDVKRIIDNLSLILDKAINVKEDLLIFDEIQECPEALTSLKYFNEDMKELALCCAGSHIGVTLSRKSFPVGQVDFLSLFPMNFEEFLMAVDKRKAKIPADFSQKTVIPVEVKSGSRVKSKSLSVYMDKYAPGLQIKISAINLHRENRQSHNYPLYLAGKI